MMDKGIYRCPNKPGQRNHVLFSSMLWKRFFSWPRWKNGIWIQRQDSIYHPLMDSPDHQVANLVDAVDLVLQRLK